jgi:hypothetical protein
MVNAQVRKEAIVVAAGEDRFLHEKWTTPAPCKLSGKDTNGAIAVFGGVHRGPGGGIPLHVHRDQDECWYILEGEYLIQVGDRKIHAKPGDFVVGPRGVPHSPCRLTAGSNLTVFQPAGMMEEFFQLGAELRQKGERGAVWPPSEQVAEYWRKHGLEIVGPPVEP